MGAMTVEQDEHPVVLTGGRTERTVPGGDIPAVAVVAVATMVSLATVAGWAGWEVLRSAAWSGALLVAALVVAVVVVVRLRPPAPERSTTAGLVLALPALGVVAVAVAGAIRGVPDGLAWFLNGDHPRHAVYAADTWVQGNLAYDVEGYPHGWHSAPRGRVVGRRRRSRPGIRRPAAPGHGRSPACCSPRRSRCRWRTSGTPWARGWAWAERPRPRSASSWAPRPCSTSSSPTTRPSGTRTPCWPPWSSRCVRARCSCGRGPRCRSSCRLPARWCSRTRGSSCSRWSRWPPCGARGRPCGDASGVPSPWSSARSSAPWSSGPPRSLAVVQGVGIEHATEAGPDSPVPLVLLGLGLGCCVVLATRWRDGAVRCVAALTLIPSLLAVVLSLGLGVALLHYYPSKLLWQSALLGLPWVAAAGALLLERLGTARPGVGVVTRRVVTWVVAVFVAYALLLPWGVAGRHLGHRRRVPRRRRALDPSGPGGGGRVARGHPDDRLGDPEPARRPPRRRDEGACAAGPADHRAGVRPPRGRRATRGALDGAGGECPRPVRVRARASRSSGSSGATP